MSPFLVSFKAFDFVMQMGWSLSSLVSTEKPCIAAGARKSVARGLRAAAALVLGAIVLVGGEWTTPVKAQPFTRVDSDLKDVWYSSSSMSDVNNDGYLDIVISGTDSSLTGVVNLYLGSNGGIFSKVDAGLDDRNGSTSIGDVNGDGRPDILVTGGNTNIYLGDGRGEFEKAGAGLTGADRSSSSMGDVNGDGHLDLIVSGIDSNDDPKTKLYLGDGIGGFTEAGAGLVDVEFASTSKGDLNGDGKLDLLVSGDQVVDGFNPVTKLYLGDGDGGFTEAGAGLADVGLSSTSIGDINEDGNLDILISGDKKYEGPITKLYLGDGNGDFTEAGVELAGVKGGDLEIVDTNEDGYKDILVSGNGVAKLYLGDGSGEFTEAGAGLVDVSNSSISEGDVDNDDDTDIIISGVDPNGEQRTSLYINNLEDKVPPVSPSAPAITDTTGGVTLEWGAVSASDLSEYRVYRDTVSIDSTTGPSNYSALASTGAGEVSYRDADVDSGATYHYRVTAVDTAGNESAFSGETSVLYESDGPPLVPQAASPQQAGSSFWIDVKVGTSSTPVDSLFGTSFTMNYDAGNVSVVEEEAGSFLGSDVVFSASDDTTAGELGIGVSRKSGSGGVSGSGVVARVKVSVADTTSAGTVLSFSFSEVDANDPDGNTIPLSPGILDLEVQQGLSVWPGDTDNDGTVDQGDVLPLGLYWGSTGPSRSATGCTWQAGLAETWAQEDATYADANGDGDVDQSDVLCIGLNWGSTHSKSAFSVLAATGAEDEPAGRLDLRRGDRTEVAMWVELYAREVESLMGMAAELTYDPSAVTIEAVERGELMGPDALLQSETEGGTLGLGISRTGSAAKKGGEVARVKLRAETDNPEIGLREGRASTAEGQTVSLSTNEGGLESLPEEVILEVPSPNPVRKQARIAYELPEAQEVRLSVYDVLGREVRTLVEQKQRAGRKEVRFEPSGLSAGTYFYRLEAGRTVKTRRVVVVK